MVRVCVPARVCDCLRLHNVSLHVSARMLSSGRAGAHRCLACVDTRRSPRRSLRGRGPHTLAAVCCSSCRTSKRCSAPWWRSSERAARPCTTRSAAPHLPSASASHRASRATRCAAAPNACERVGCVWGPIDRVRACVHAWVLSMIARATPRRARSGVCLFATCTKAHGGAAGGSKGSAWCSTGSSTRTRSEVRRTPPSLLQRYGVLECSKRVGRGRVIHVHTPIGVPLWHTSRVRLGNGSCDRCARAPRVPVGYRSGTGWVPRCARRDARSAESDDRAGVEGDRRAV